MQTSSDDIIKELLKFPAHDFDSVREKRDKFLDIYGYGYSSGKPIPKHDLTKYLSTFGLQRMDIGLRDLLNLPAIDNNWPEDLKERWHISIGLMSALPDEVLKQLPTEFEGAWVSYHITGGAMALNAQLEDLEKPLLEYFSKRLAGATQ